jgi:hypothetical protein
VANRTLSWHEFEDEYLLELVNDIGPKWAEIGRRMVTANFRKRESDHYKTRYKQLIKDLAKANVDKPLSDVEMLALHRPWKL